MRLHAAPEAAALAAARLSALMVSAVEARKPAETTERYFIHPLEHLSSWSKNYRDEVIATSSAAGFRKRRGMPAHKVTPPTASEGGVIRSEGN